MENYNHVVKQLENPKIEAIYKTLGPFDYTLYEPPDEQEKEPKKKGPEKKTADDSSEAASVAQSSKAGTEFDETDSKRVFQEHWDTRKSGAQYRGEVNEQNKRPDGRGIKIHNKSSLYEGYWQDGKCNGLGRGINSNGEVYQGMFHNDTMEGEGFYYWPDGRIFEGIF